MRPYKLDVQLQCCIECWAQMQDQVAFLDLIGWPSVVVNRWRHLCQVTR